ncbi:MAG: IS21-like element helper ATPase IstB [Candidatus Binatia bacterium]
MTHEETFQKLSEIRLPGFSRALREQLDNPDSYQQLAFEDRLGILVDREGTDREARRLTRRLQMARLRDRAAAVEDIDFGHPRGLDHNLVRRLSTCEWIQKKQNLVITGSTGCGKTFVACAFGQKACREGFSVIYRRVPRMLSELHIAHGDGSLPRLLARWAKTDLLILDDWGLAPLTTQHRHDLLEVIEDRHGERATLIAAQLPLKDWHKYIGDPAVADAALDRIIHSAHHLAMHGESMRKKRSTLALPSDKQ